MTSTTTRPVSTDRRPLLPVAAATFLGTCAFTAWGMNSTGELFVIGAVALVATTVVIGLVVPRVQDGPRAAGVGLGLSIAGLLLVLVFWAGLTPALAVGGVLLGAAARRTRQRPGLGGAAVAVGALALLGYVAIYVTDWMASNNIAGM